MHSHMLLCNAIYLCLYCMYILCNMHNVHMCIHVCMLAKLLQSCPTLCDPMDCSCHDCSQLGSSVQGILQASGLPCPSPGDLPDPGIKPTCFMSPALAGRFSTTSASGKPYIIYIYTHVFILIYRNFTHL